MRLAVLEIRGTVLTTRFGQEREQQVALPWTSADVQAALIIP